MLDRFDLPTLRRDLLCGTRASIHTDDCRVFTGLGPDS